MYVGGKYVGQGEVVATLCVMGDVAVKDGVLSEPQFLALAESTGRKIRADYPQLAGVVALSDESARRASPESSCSQILLALTGTLSR